MKKKIFLLSFLSILLSLCALAGSVIYALEATAVTDAHTLLRAQALEIASAIDAGAEYENLFALARSVFVRVTLIASDGTVQKDNMASADTMENHLQRPEVQKALANGEGMDERESGTLGEKYIYCAYLLKDGSILRTARSYKTALGMMLQMRSALITGAVLALLLALLLSYFLSRAIVSPLEKLNLEKPDENDAYDELTPLLRRLADQQKRLSEQLEAEKNRNRQIEKITSAMREGLIMLDESMHVLSLNESACDFLAVKPDACIGKHIYELNRSEETVEMAENARAGKKAQHRIALAGRVLEASLSPVTEGSDAYGYVLLLIDVTEKSEGERMRQEFSANVSHELMTPLTSVSGYAELIESGMAKDGDVRNFAARIHQETGRMILLIEDIMRLSRLDEGDVPMNAEDVSLVMMAKDAASMLSQKASARNITISVRGTAKMIHAVRQPVWDIVHNLMDNAVKYNVDNGRVDVEVIGSTLIVSDTGIGIPKEQQQKVFERFYRVDKSRSKQTGGTGLGLSIVKHAAEFLNAEIKMDSTPGSGTRITVDFGGQ